MYLDQIEAFDDSTPSNSTPVSSNTVVSSTLVASLGDSVVPTKKADIQASPTPSTEGFSDVSSTHPYAPAIHFLKSKDIVAGNNGKFAPEATITRAELVKMVF